MTYEFTRSDAEWRAMLDPNSYNILRHAATEAPFTGELNGEWREGTYVCRGCGNELFRGTAKFDAGCGWPSFWEPLRTDAVEEVADHSHGMVRTEVRCAKCGGHLGHVFPDGHGTPTGIRYCMNSASLNFDPDAA